MQIDTIDDEDDDDDDDDDIVILESTPERAKTKTKRRLGTPSQQAGESRDEDLNGATISFGLLYLQAVKHSIPRNQQCLVVRSVYCSARYENSDTNARTPHAQVHSDIYRELTHVVSPPERSAAQILKEYTLKNMKPSLTEYMLFPVIEDETWSLAILIQNLRVKDDTSSSSDDSSSNQVATFRDVIRKGNCILHLDPNPVETTKHSSKRIARRIRSVLNKAGGNYKVANMPTITMAVSMLPKVRTHTPFETETISTDYTILTGKQNDGERSIRSRVRRFVLS